MAKKKRKKTGNAFIDAIHDAQDKQDKTESMNVRVVMSDGMMAVKPVGKGKQRGKRRK